MKKKKSVIQKVNYKNLISFILCFVLIFVLLAGTISLFDFSKNEIVPIYYKYDDVDLIYFKLKTHNCPNCAEQMEPFYKSEFHDADSEYVKENNIQFEYDSGGYYDIKGKIEVRIPYFKCRNCKYQISATSFKNGK